jgi:predicted NodU family carbamoyl transferase
MGLIRVMVVGLSPSHDNSIAVVLDGRLIYAGELERFSRYKHSGPVESSVC